jgi:hypothetical protein
MLHVYTIGCGYFFKTAPVIVFDDYHFEIIVYVPLDGDRIRNSYRGEPKLEDNNFIS